MSDLTLTNITVPQVAKNNPPEFDERAVRALIATQQGAFQKSRGSHALALMVSTAYVAIRKIISDAPAEIQAAILDEHGVPAASVGTSIYTPWIKVQWGEPDLQGSTFKDSQGVTRTLWVPDRSMEIYHHTMEALEERGVITDDPKAVAKIIMASKGALAMARERQTVTNKERRAAAVTVADRKRQLFLEEAVAETVDINIDVPDDMGEYATILVRHIKDSVAFEVLGVVDKNATSALDKMAKEQFDALTQRKKDREREQRHRRELERRLEEQKNQLLSGLDAAGRRAALQRVAEAAKADVSDSKAVKAA